MIDQITYAEGCERLNRKIAERYGDGPDVMEELTIQVLPCPQEGTGRKGHAIIAYPVGEKPTSENLVASYFGDALRSEEPR